MLNTPVPKPKRFLTPNNYAFFLQLKRLEKCLTLVS